MRTGTAGGEDETKEEDDDVKTQQIREELQLEDKLESLLQAFLVFCFKQLCQRVVLDIDGQKKISSLHILIIRTGF